MKTTLDLIKDFVRENYGESELENPSYDLNRMAHYVDTHNELNQEIKKYVDEEITLEIERDPELYFQRTEEWGDGRVDYVYNEEKALYNVLEDLDGRDLMENQDICYLFEKYVKNICEED